MTGACGGLTLPRMTPTVHILILAAGASSRMQGVDKLLQPVAGQPMLRHLAQVALGTGCPVTVTLPPDAPARGTALDGLPLDRLPIPDARDGMSRSIVHGVRALTNGGPHDGVMILPADMPGFTTAALRCLIQAFQGDPSLILRGGSQDGEPGHPAIFPRDLWPALAQVTGDEGGRSVLKQNQSRVRVIALPGPMALLDLDTPEDWVAWRTRP